MKEIVAEKLIEMTWYISKGVGVTLQYTVLAVTIGFCVGLFLNILSNSRYRLLRGFVAFYVSVFRGTPLLAQLYLVYFALPMVLPVRLEIFGAALLTFSLNSGAYISQVIKSGIMAIDKGQFEAAAALNIPKWLMWRDIILPQAVRNILPSLINEGCDMLKETALVSVLGEKDIMRRAQLVAAEHYTYLQPLMIAAACYYVLVTLFNAIIKHLEKRFHY